MMTDHENNKIIYDWLTFTTQIHSVDDIINFLGLSDVTFIQLDRGMNGYSRCMHFGGISICYGGRDDMGICCCMSGQGCRSFETYGNGDYESIFAEIIDNWNEDSAKRQMNISRLDVAYDDFEGLLDIDTVAYQTLRHEYVARAHKWNVTFSDEGTTTGIGSMRSDTYIRIYDKKAERKRDDLEHWVRCEIQLRGACALGFIKLCDGVCDNYFKVLNNYVRFVDPSENDSNKRRWLTSAWWSDFLESYDSVSIFDRPGVDYNIMKLDNYVFGQCSGAVSTMIEIIGVEEFMKQLREVVNRKDLNPKYKDLKNQCGTSSDSIIAFLEERGAVK